MFSVQFGHLLMTVLDLFIRIYSVPNSSQPTLKQGSIFPFGGPNDDLLDVSLLNNGNGLCFDENWAVADNGVIFTWSCSFEDNQRWDIKFTDEFVYTAQGKYPTFRIVNKYTGKCLTTYLGATDNDTIVVIYQCKDALPSKLAQIWYGNWVDESSSFFYIIHPNSGRCLTVNLSNQGQTAYIHNCVYDLSQKWMIEE